ncbi:sodium/hydrogen antiporter [Candida albicans SC5314]|nr:sodium/hydrogen antiporter [Candida albicans SC5314]KHC86806.1 sodium/hydrogen antiporter [Candida albicans SC5314]
MAWSQLELEPPHIAYACVGIFSTLFSLVSLFVKERLYIGEATVASIAGLILGPHCLNWFDPVSWGNSDYITLEICRIVLCIQIVAVAVELPKKYMMKHWLSVTIFLLPVMTCGWLIVGLFIWCLIPHFTFNDGLLVSACVTATDPVLAAAVVGKGKFAERVPGHLRNLLSAESGCNDGMAFPFIFLSLNLIIHSGHAGEIVKDWFLLTILWECIFGCLLGTVIGYVLRKLVAFAENQNLIDRESFLAIFVFIAFISAGIGSMLGVDDLLVSFAAGTAFGWNGAFAKKTEESHVSTVIDLLLNLSFFVYFGAIIPWPQFNNADLGLNVWRLVVLAFVIIFLRRIPAVVALKPITPDVKTWREALFCGHFGPIGVGAIFASILARKDLEAHYTTEETPLHHLPNEDFPHYQLLATIWPIVCFIVITSIIVHGSSVAVLTLGKRLNRMAITMSFTTDQEGNGSGGWMQRLQKLDRTTTSFSLHRVDTMAPTEKSQPETTGTKVRPTGGAKRKKNHKDDRTPPEAQILQLGGNKTPEPESASDTLAIPNKTSGLSAFGEKPPTKAEKASVPTVAYQDGDQVIIEDQYGEVMENLKLTTKPVRAPDIGSIHSMESLERHLTQYSTGSGEYTTDEDTHGLQEKLSRSLSRRSYYKKDDPNKRKVYAHRVDDLIVIENEDGDIIRRYKVNKHAPAPRARSGSIMGMVKSMVGIKPPPEISVTDLEHGTQHKIILPEEENTPMSSKTEQKLEDTIANILQENHTQPISEESADEESADEEETEVEKKRRLQALGYLPSSRRDREDEEE